MEKEKRPECFTASAEKTERFEGLKGERRRKYNSKPLIMVLCVSASQ